jgi:hypothetical protein
MRKSISDLHVRILNEEDGIICFSGKVDDPILWSHYAKIGREVHKGVAFEVSGHMVSRKDNCITFEVNGEKYRNLHKVAYNKARKSLPWPLPSDLVGEKARALMKDFFKQKSGSWKYEDEYRFVVGLENCKTSGEMFLWEIPPHFIRRVIIGFRSSLSELYVRRALQVHGFEDVQVAKAKLSQTTYKVEISD